MSLRRSLRRSKWYVKNIVRGFAFAFPFAVELRDNYGRRTWAVEPLVASQMVTGDIVLVAHRWYTRESFGAMWYSFLCKALSKSSWDSCGVIINETGFEPHILIQDYKTVTYMPLGTYLETHVPRGVAVRRISRKYVKPVDPAIVKKFVEEATATPQKTNPWYLFRAMMKRPYLANRHFGFACRTSEARMIYLNKVYGHYSKGAIEDAKQSWEALQYASDQLAAAAPDPITPQKRTCGSLTASFLATAGLLPAPKPDVSSFAPADFLLPLPLIDCEVLDSRVIFKD